MEIIAKFYPHIWSQKLIDQIVITSEVVIKEEIKGVGEAEFVMPIAPGIKEECKVELYESNGNEDNLLFRGYIHEINPVWGQFQSLKIIARGEKAIFHKRKTLRKHTFTAQALSSILQKLLEPYNTEFNEDWGFEIQKEETLSLEIAQGDDYYDIFDEICEQKELFWTVVDGTVHFKKHGEDLRATQILEYDGHSPNPWNITNIELIGTASGGNVVLVEDSRWNLTVDKSQYSGVLTGVVSKQIRKGDDSEKAKQFAKEQARPQRKYKIQVANWSIIAHLWDRIKVEVVNTNSFYDYSGEAIVQSKTTSYSNASKVVVYGIQEFLVSPFTAENRVENVEKSIKLLRQRKGGGETPAPQVDLSWYASSSAVNQAIQSQNTKIEQKADSSFVQWVAQTAQTALNTANEAKQTAESKAPIQHTHNKSEVWLDQVDNTSDENKPVSKATKKALELKCSFADIVDNLNTEEIKPLSAKQGKVLKGLIDNINRILVSDDTDLDQLQEIVNYIKQNKKILSQLGISNIVGLVEALEGKANKVHTHTKSQISDFPTSMPASDVHEWAKKNKKPDYAWNEIKNKPDKFTPSEHNHNQTYHTKEEIAQLLSWLPNVPENMLTAGNLNNRVREISGWIVVPGNGSVSASIYLRHPNGRMYEFFSDGNGAFGVRDKTNNRDVFRITPNETIFYKELNANNLKIKNLADPNNNKDAANKQYVDKKITEVNTALQNLGQTNQQVLTKAEWKALTKKDPNKIYFVKGVGIYVGAEKIISSEAPLWGVLA